MAFLGKLGNILEDAASFAVPAGLTLAGALVPGGLPVSQLLLPAAASGLQGFARNEAEERMRKAQRQARQNQIRANVINTLNPRAGAQARPVEMPKSGILETIAKTGAMGVQAYGQAKQLADAAKTRKLQQEQAQASLDEFGQRQADREAANFYALSQLGQPKTGWGAGGGGFSGTGNVVSRTSTPALPEGIGTEQAAAYYAAQQADEARRAEQRRLDAGLELDKRELAFQEQMAERNMAAKLRMSPAELARVGAGLVAGNEDLTREQFFRLPTIMSLDGALMAREGTGLTAEDKAYLWSNFNQSAAAAEAALTEADRKGVSDFKNLLVKDGTLKEQAELTRALSFINNAILTEGGMADVQLMKMLARLQDPGSVVREAEYETLAGAIAAFEAAGIRAEGWFTGNKLNDDGRSGILELAYGGYQGRAREMDRIIDLEIVSQVQQGFNEDWMQSAAERFRLPKLADSYTPDQWNSVRARFPSLSQRMSSDPIFKDVFAVETTPKAVLPKGATPTDNPQASGQTAPSVPMLGASAQVPMRAAPGAAYDAPMAIGGAAAMQDTLNLGQEMGDLEELIVQLREEIAKDEGAEMAANQDTLMPALGRVQLQGYR